MTRRRPTAYSSAADKWEGFFDKKRKGGALILTSEITKFFSNGLDFENSIKNPRFHLGESSGHILRVWTYIGGGNARSQGVSAAEIPFPFPTASHEARKKPSADHETPLILHLVLSCRNKKQTSSRPSPCDS